MASVIELQWHWDFICGSLSGVANCLSGYILDTLKVKIQMNPQMTMYKYIIKMKKDHTLLKLFDGMYYPLITVPIVNAVVWGSYQFYKKITGKQQLSLLDGIENGAFAGFANTFIVSPVQLIKCRMQLDENKFINSQQCLRYIIKLQGIKGLFKGMFATMTRQVPCYSSQFATYQIFKSLLTTSPSQSLSFFHGFFVGALSGINCWLISYPQDIIKTKIQVDISNKYSKNKYIFDGGFVDCAKDIYHNKGIRGFFIGIQPCLLRAAVANSFGFAAYQRAKHYFRKEDIL